MLVVAVSALVACGGGGKGGMNFGDNEFPIVTVGTSNAEMLTTYPATIKGMQDVEIRPKIQGFITRVNVHEGQSVGAGQILFVLDNETYQAAVEEEAEEQRAAVAPAPAPAPAKVAPADGVRVIYVEDLS